MEEKIVQHFIRNAPPAEMKAVVRSIQQLFGGRCDESALNSALQQYNIENFVAIDVGEPEQLLLCKYNQRSDGTFYHPISRSVYTVDHAALTGVIVEGADQPSAPTEQQKAIHSAVLEYVNTTFAGGALLVHYDDTSYHVLLSVQKLDTKNKWSGRWRAAYKVGITDDAVQIAGQVWHSYSLNTPPAQTSIEMHYYEDGNVRLDTSRNHRATLKVQRHWAKG